eukprot:Skav220531  [mRNA]  locus=scaffold6435:70213:82150:- [translate_table: standard]
MGTACPFAHCKEELNSPPDLSKTKLCVPGQHSAWRVSCKHRDGKFANKQGESLCRPARRHSELRATGSVYKTELCRAWAAGVCKANPLGRRAAMLTESRNCGAQVEEWEGERAGRSATSSAFSTGQPQDGTAEGFNDAMSDMGLSDVSTFCPGEGRLNRQQTAPPVAWGHPAAARKWNDCLCVDRGATETFRSYRQLRFVTLAAAVFHADTGSINAMGVVAHDYWSLCVFVCVHLCPSDEVVAKINASGEARLWNQLSEQQEPLDQHPTLALRMGCCKDLWMWWSHGTGTSWHTMAHHGTLGRQLREMESNEVFADWLSGLILTKTHTTLVALPEQNRQRIVLQV